MPCWVGNSNSLNHLKQWEAQEKYYVLLNSQSEFVPYSRFLKKPIIVCVLFSLTLCYTVDYNLPGSSVCGIFQARILEWVAISFSRASSWPRDWICVSSIAGRFFTHWVIGEVHLGYQTPAKYMICKYFLQFCRLFFYFLDGVLWHKLWWHPVFLFFVCLFVLLYLGFRCLT